MLLTSTDHKSQTHGWWWGWLSSLRRKLFCYFATAIISAKYAICISSRFNGFAERKQRGQRCSKWACAKKTKEVNKAFTVLVPFVSSPLLLWGEKCRFPGRREDLVERFCKASSTFVGNMQIDFQTLRVHSLEDISLLSKILIPQKATKS